MGGKESKTDIIERTTDSLYFPHLEKEYYFPPLERGLSIVMSLTNRMYCKWWSGFTSWVMGNLVASTPTSWNIVLQVLSSFIRSPAILKSPFWGGYVERLQKENDAWPALHYSRPNYSNYTAEAPDVMGQRLDVLAELWPSCRFLNKKHDCCCLGLLLLFIM